MIPGPLGGRAPPPVTSDGESGEAMSTIDSLPSDQSPPINGALSNAISGFDIGLRKIVVVRGH